MKDAEQVFLERGAQCVGGDLILRQKVVGQYRNGSLIVTDDGKAELEIDEVEAVEAAAPKAPRKARAKAAKPDADEDLTDLDGLVEGE